MLGASALRAEGPARVRARVTAAVSSSPTSDIRPSAPDGVDQSSQSYLENLKSCSLRLPLFARRYVPSSGRNPPLSFVLARSHPCQVAPCLRLHARESIQASRLIEGQTRQWPCRAEAGRAREGGALPTSRQLRTCSVLFARRWPSASLQLNAEHGYGFLHAENPLRGSCRAPPSIYSNLSDSRLDFLCAGAAVCANPKALHKLPKAATPLQSSTRISRTRLPQNKMLMLVPGSAPPFFQSICWIATAG